MSQIELFSPRLVEVINIKNNSIHKSFKCDDYFLAWDAVDDLVVELGLDDYSYMVSKITDKE